MRRRAGHEQLAVHFAAQTCWLAVCSASEEVQERAHARGDLASCSLVRLADTLEESGKMLLLVLEEVQLPSALLLFLFFALGVASLDCLEL
jgi:hypothetical protein